MNIELVLSPALYDLRSLRNDHATVAVDILRATSAICAAFMAGASEVLPLDSLEPLAILKQNGYIAAAERNGMKIDDAPCGNSPTEYLSMNLHGARIAYSTTNGTVAILRAVDAAKLYIGAFSNISTLADALAADNTLRDVVILCSGWKGDPSIEDTLFAGALISKFKSLTPSLNLVNDAASMALDLWLMAEEDPMGYCSKATHVHRLRRLGVDDDIRWAFRLDTCSLLPVYDRSVSSIRLA